MSIAPGLHSAKFCRLQTHAERRAFNTTLSVSFSHVERLHNRGLVDLTMPTLIVAWAHAKRDVNLNWVCAERDTKVSTLSMEEP